MNNIAFTGAMIWVFGFVTFIVWALHLGEKDKAKKREAAIESESKKQSSAGGSKSEGHLGALIISLIGLVFSIVMYLLEKSDYDAILSKFKKGDDIYCYSSSFDSKWEKVNKNDGWYLEEDTLKHKDKRLKFGIYRCKDSF